MMPRIISSQNVFNSTYHFSSFQTANLYNPPSKNPVYVRTLDVETSVVMTSFAMTSDTKGRRNKFAHNP